VAVTLGVMPTLGRGPTEPMANLVAHVKEREFPCIAPLLIAARSSTSNVDGRVRGTQVA
jgi:hypothetical protein